MILRPETSVSPLTAVVVIGQTVIHTRLPERHEQFCRVVRLLGYVWSGAMWQRQIEPRFHGAVLDRVVELAHTLLTAGFTVEVPDDLVPRVIAGDYHDECRRWIKQWAGCDWFVIEWRRPDDFYAAARRLRGSRYEPPYVVVPSDSFLEILDFAEAHTFQVSENAQQIIATAQRRYESAVLVIPQPRRLVKAQPARLGEIDPELRDDMDDDNESPSVATDRR